MRITNGLPRSLDEIRCKSRLAREELIAREAFAALTLFAESYMSVCDGATSFEEQEVYAYLARRCIRELDLKDDRIYIKSGSRERAPSLRSLERYSGRNFASVLAAKHELALVREHYYWERAVEIGELCVCLFAGFIAPAALFFMIQRDE